MICWWVRNFIRSDGGGRFDTSVPMFTPMYGSFWAWARASYNDDESAANKKKVLVRKEGKMVGCYDMSWYLGRGGGRGV